MNGARVTLPQHRYYRAAIVPAIASYCGYESHAEAHRAIKSAFYGIPPNDPNLPSMADMPKEECQRFMDFALRQAAELSLVIPDPRRFHANA